MHRVVKMRSANPRFPKAVCNSTKKLEKLYLGYEM